MADFELTDDDLPVVVRCATEWAEEVLPVFERTRPDDPRPRAAIEGAREFAAGARRSTRRRRPPDWPPKPRATPRRRHICIRSRKRTRSVTSCGPR
ncbi:putative immunity protein [Gordonia hongkongensis]|uniref:putative immunity protein n=1 Tax=Gordonia hongkongensis TaxID=1701090 RepID=UPI003AF0BC37